MMEEGMSRYLQDKFVGTYRVLAEYDQSTNDYIRNELGLIDPSFNDLYIPCFNGGRINYIGKGILQYYIPSIRKGRFLLERIEKEESELLTLVFDITETDSEFAFYFKTNSIYQLERFLKPKTRGANISPFSVKNLPKNRYVIPKSDLAHYQKIINDYYKNDEGLMIYQIAICTKNFCNSIPKHGSLQKKLGLKGKFFIHKIGAWDDYLAYLSKMGADNKIKEI